MPTRGLTAVAAVAAVLLAASCAGSPEKASREGALAQQQLDAGQPRLAQTTVADAIKERDDLPALHLLRGRIELALGNFSAAYQAYQDALALDAANLEALQGVAQLGLRGGNLAESEKAAQKILALQPNQIDALVITGVHQLVRNKIPDAIATADRVLAQDPTNEGGVILKARSQFLQGDGQAALATIRAREKLLGRTEALARTELELLREARDAKGMLDLFAYLETERPNDVDLRLDEANVRYKLGDIGVARRLLRDALITQRPSPGQVAAAIALWREYDPSPLASADLSRLADTRPETRLTVARYFLAESKPLAANRLMNGLNSSEANGVRSRVMVASGQTRAAVRLANATLQDDKTQCDSLITRALSSVVQNQLENAIADGQQAVAECPLEPAAAVTLVAAFQARRDVLGIHRSFADAVSRMPQDSKLSTAFSSWLVSQGRAREAIAEARRLTNKAPALVSGWRSYLDVCSRHPEQGCSADAKAGLEVSRTIFAVDLPPGNRVNRGLSGRLKNR